ncbi:Cytochrome P450 [Mycena kentingensis (nom. inval.)]|nr:Cytochrome P450 [Mycena kentingensis (nom. inval.)]
MPSAALAVLALLPLLLVAYSVSRRRRRRQRNPLPPGPPKWFLVGNLFNMPTARQYEVFTHWTRVYNSDILHLSVAGKSIIVLSSAAAAHELLEKRSGMYSDRPRMPMVRELMGWEEHSLGLMGYGPRWLLHRKVLQTAFNKGAIPTYNPSLSSLTERLLRDLLRDPAAFMDHFKKMSGALVMLLVYGLDVNSAADPYIHANEAALEGIITAGVAGRYLVDAIPVLKYIPEWFPGAGFKRQARIWREATKHAVEAPFAETCRRMESSNPSSSRSLVVNLTSIQAEGTCNPCFVSSALEDPSPTDLAQIEIVKNSAGSVYTASVDTLRSALSTFVLAMLAYPEVQHRTYAEISRFLQTQEEGEELIFRLPRPEDELGLPYIGAVVKEVLRWRNITPLGSPRPRCDSPAEGLTRPAIPHCVSEEDVYRGYRIPKGAVVLGNVWAILHDETVYSNPDAFNPDRFLGDTPEPDPDAAFGFGRRACPGQHLAKSIIFLSIARILAVFEIHKAIDAEDGVVVVEPSGAYSDGLSVSPLPFKCAFQLRSEEVLEGFFPK